MLKNGVFDWGKGVVSVGVFLWKSLVLHTVAFFDFEESVEKQPGFFTVFHRFLHTFSHVISLLFLSVRVGFIHIFNSTYKYKYKDKYLVIF